jgi:hypothetical protein
MTSIRRVQYETTCRFVYYTGETQEHHGAAISPEWTEVGVHLPPGTADAAGWAALTAHVATHARSDVRACKADLKRLVAHAATR